MSRRRGVARFQSRFRGRSKFESLFRRGARGVFANGVGFPGACDLEVGGDVLGECGDVDVTVAVVQRGEVMAVADGGVTLPVGERLLEVAERGGLLLKIGRAIEERQGASAADFFGVVTREPSE